MAFRDLVEGDCGGPSPLMRLTSHFVKDHSLKEEGVRDIFGSASPFEAGNSDQLVKQFLEESSVNPQTFKMESLLQEMRDIDQNIYPPVTAPGVVEELTNQDTSWANQYLQSGGHFQVNFIYFNFFCYNTCLVQIINYIFVNRKITEMTSGMLSQQFPMQLWPFQVKLVNWVLVQNGPRNTWNKASIIPKSSLTVQITHLQNL